MGTWLACSEMETGGCTHQAGTSQASWVCLEPVERHLLGWFYRPRNSETRMFLLDITISSLSGAKLKKTESVFCGSTWFHKGLSTVEMSPWTHTWFRHTDTQILFHANGAKLPNLLQSTQHPHSKRAGIPSRTSYMYIHVIINYIMSIIKLT